MTTPWKEIRGMKITDAQHESIRQWVTKEVAELIWTQFCHMWSSGKLERDFNILQLETMEHISLGARMDFSEVVCHVDHATARVFVATTSPGDRSFKLYGVGALPTTEQQAEFRNCTYCMAVGACPRCWGRAAIEELKMKHHSFVDDLTTILAGGKMDDTTKALLDGLIDRYEVK